MSSFSQIASYNFSSDDQKHFGRLSGDINPIHIDRNHARKSMWGERILHGMNGVLWALERMAQFTKVRFKSADIIFIKPIFLDEKIRLLFHEENKTLQLMHSNILLTEISLDTVDDIASVKTPTTTHTRLFTKTEATFERLETGQEFSFNYKTPILNRTDFPHLSNLIGTRRVQEIAKISTIVGMHIPGKFSLLSNVRFRFHELEKTPKVKIKSVDDRFKLISCVYDGCCLKAEIRAFSLNTTPKIPSIMQISKKIGAKKYFLLRPIIIGGTRGLGCWVAKTLAAGGSNVLGTYNVGKDEAYELMNEAAETGAKISFQKFSVGECPESLLKNSNANCLFYMATPPIFAKRNKAFSADQFDEFINFYVIELEKIVRKGHQNKVNVFFIPSSIAIEMPNFQVPEYARAKEESEKLCRKLSKELNVHIINPRLPALKTDQTNGISQKPNADILGHLTPFFQQMLSAI